MSGDNGDFGDKPFGTTAWTQQAVKFFSGEFDDSVFNPNQVNIDAVFDANYPSEVKKTILELAEFRQDFFYFRDFGLDKYTYDQFKMAAKEFDHSKFAASYIHESKQRSSRPPALLPEGDDTPAIPHLP